MPLCLFSKLSFDNKFHYIGFDSLLAQKPIKKLLNLEFQAMRVLLSARSIFEILRKIKQFQREKSLGPPGFEPRTPA